MKNVEYSRKKVIIYLIAAFVIAYAVQIVASFVYNSGNVVIGQLIIAVTMAVPLLSVLISGSTLKGMGWKPRLKGKIRYIFIAWFLPAVLTFAGAALYFLIFPQHFDLSGEYFIANGAGEALDMLKEQGMTYGTYCLIQILASLTYAPAINMFLAIGEEAGWRGFLYPQLKKRFGRKFGRVIGGIIWGMWHWPLIWLIGYEYGRAASNSAGYFAYPFSGMLLFCLITIGWGILHDWLYEKSGCIWIPALFHGAINAVAAIPLTVCITDTGSFRLLGPASVGILSGFPFLVFAGFVFFRKNKEKSGKTDTKEI